ncbi:MAG: hypothetical protein FMNOHCHN_03598 [Ignavibacteriaceae bacterium]|nr:hypothetical protein [Ignavibacteriaceae bacterium]
MFKIQTIAKSLVLVGIAGTMMGNQGCKEQTVDTSSTERQLRRRVQLGKIDAPVIQLPASFSNTKFNFGYAANIQMYDILRKTQSFSTANIDPDASFDPSGLDDSAKGDFYKCEAEDQEMQVYDYNTNARLKASVASKETLSSSAACLIDMPQALIKGAITNFQLTSGTGASLSLGNIVAGLGVEGAFDFKKYTMTVSLMAKHPLEIGDHYFSTTVNSSYANQKEMSGKITYQTFGFGLKSYRASDLSKVVDDGLTQAVSDLNKNWSTDDPWYAMVMRSCDKYVYINGGFGNDAGLKVGDIVKIANVKYFWKGDPCHSKLKGEIADKVVAYAKITSVGRNIAQAWIIENDPKYPHGSDKIYPGSRVYVEKLVEQVKAEEEAAKKAASGKK